jgi:hypothetical protein
MLAARPFRWRGGTRVLDRLRPGSCGRVLLVLLTVYALALILPEPYRVRHPLGSLVVSQFEF